MNDDIDIQQPTSVWVWPPNGFKSDFAKSLSTCPCFPGFVVALQPVSNLAQGRIWNYFVNSEFKLLWPQIIVTKQKQNISLICYMVTYYWGLMCMWYINKLFNIIWYEDPTHQSPPFHKCQVTWLGNSQPRWEAPATYMCCFMMLAFVLYITLGKSMGNIWDWGSLVCPLPSTLVFNECCFPSGNAIKIGLLKTSAILKQPDT